MCIRDRQMTGDANCVAFLDYDINGAGGIGDAPGERGNNSCNSGFYLYSAEPEPIGTPSLSGYTRFWEMVHPDFAAAGIHLDLVFSRVSSAGFIIERADGRTVADFIETTSIPLPGP